MSNVIRIDGTEDNIQFLERVKKDVAESGHKKILVLILDDDDSKFNLRMRSTGIKHSEVLALLKCAETSTLEEMGYL